MLVLWLTTGVLAGSEAVEPPGGVDLDPGASGPVQRHKSSVVGYSYEEHQRRYEQERQIARDIGDELTGVRRKQKAIKKRLKKAVENTHTETTDGLLRTAATIAAVPDSIAARSVAEILAEFHDARAKAHALEMQLLAVQAAVIEHEMALQAAADEEAAIIALLLF